MTEETVETVPNTKPKDVERIRTAIAHYNDTAVAKFQSWLWGADREFAAHIDEQFNPKTRSLVVGRLNAVLASALGLASEEDGDDPSSRSRRTAASQRRVK
jgi:hypothetical protein